MDEIETDKNSEAPVTEEQMPVKWWRKRKFQIAIVGGVLLLVIGIIFIFASNDKNGQYDSSNAKFEKGNNGERVISQSQAVKEGKSLSNNQCEGEGVPYKLSQSPMKPEDFTIIVPYGLMVGGHVTPIDHQYFGPRDYKSKPDAYEVKAMADSRIVDITARPRPFGQEYRMVFTISCTFFYYYDLVTGLTPEIKEVYNKSISGNDHRNRKPIDIPVKAGQIIGRIGGQTLDFAVWDTTKPLQGFLVPEHYSSLENWKIFTADPLDYYTEDLKKFILSRYVRTAEPISGKIDYDIDGRLIGNWFLEGANGYEGDKNAKDGAYWTTHLSFSPNLYVTDWFVISIGDFPNPKEGLGAQFVTPKNTPNPKDISVETGLVKYDLSFWSYTKGGGGYWDQNSMATNIGIEPNARDSTKGCALVQMIEARKIKFESFKDKKCDNVSAFSSAVKIYTR